MKIAELRDPSLFQALVRRLMLAEHGAAYQVVDDSGGDGGLDGFLRTSGELHAFYCPEKPDRVRYAAKMRSDLEKARRLRDEGGYPVRTFVFITPETLREPLQRELRDIAKAAGFDDGISVSGELLEALLARHPELYDDFPALSYARVSRALRELGDELRATMAQLLLDGGESRVRMQGGIAEVLEQGSRILQQMEPPPAVQPAALSGDEEELLHGYALWLVETYDDVELPGLPRRGQRGDLPLEKVFVALRGGLGGAYEMRHGQAYLEEQARWMEEGLDHEELTPAQRYRYRCRIAAVLAQNPHPETLRERDRPHLYQTAAEQAVPLSEAFRRERRLVVLGDPGSGKTTLVRWLAIQFARAHLRERAEVEVLGQHVDPEAEDGEQTVSLGPTRVPILLRIPQFAQEREAAPGRRLAAVLGHHLGAGYGQSVVNARGDVLDPHRLNALFRRLLAEGRVVLLLDGLDEITDPRARREIAMEIDEFMTGVLDPPDAAVGEGAAPRAGGNQAVVTSRIVGYNLAPLRSEAAHLTIEPMAPRAVERFCDLWMRAAHQAAVPSNRWNDEAERRSREEAERLKRAIAALRERGDGDLATNPLLVTILAMVFRDGVARTGSASFPRERVRLYDIAVRILIRTWHQRAWARGDSVFSEDKVLAALAPVAEWMHTHSSIGVIDEGTLGDLLRTRLSEPDAEAFHAVLRSEVGLLAARGEGVYGFLHLTFQEFLAARALAERPGPLAAHLAAYLGEPRWREPSLMALGLAGARLEPADFRALLDALLDAPDPLSRVLPRVEALLVAAIPDVPAFPEPVLARIVDQLLERYGRDGVQRRLPGLWAEIERIARACTTGSLKTVAEQRFLEPLRAPAAPDRVRVVATLLRAIRFYTPALAAALADAVEMDDERWGWPVDRALRDVATLHPALLPGSSAGLKALLVRNAALAARFGRDPGWVRVGIALYGGLDGGAAEAAAAQEAEIAQRRERIRELEGAGRRGDMSGAEELDALGAEIAEREAAIRERKRAEFRFGPARIHRDSPLTPHLVRILRADGDAAALAGVLREQVRDARDPVLVRDALVALVALGVPARNLAGLPEPVLARARAGLRRIQASLAPVLERAAVSMLEDLQRTDLSRWDPHYLRYTLASVSRLLRGPLFQAPELAPFWTRAPEGSADSLLAESLVRDVVAPVDDPAYAWAVILDTRGKSLGSDPARLARVLARVPRCTAARWHGARPWVRYDPLAPVAEAPEDALAVALDVLAALPDVFDFVRGWLLVRLAPLLGQAGLLTEAVLLCHFAISDRYGARRETLAALAGAGAAAGPPRPRDGVERALVEQVASIADPYLRVRAAFRLLAFVPRLLHADGGARAGFDERRVPEWIEKIAPPDRRAWAYGRMVEHVVPDRRPALVARAVEAARQVAAPAARARLLARLALDPVGAATSPERLVPAVFVAVDEVVDGADRIQLLADLHEAIRDLEGGAALRDALAWGLQERVAEISGPLERAAAQGLLAPPLEMLDRQFGGRIRGIGVLALAALLADAEEVLGAGRDPSAGESAGGAEGEPDDRLRWRAREGRNALEVATARRVDELAAAGRTGEAAALLTLVSGAEGAALPHARGWLAHPDKALRRHAALILAEAGDLDPRTVPAVCDWLSSPEDLPRARAIRLLSFGRRREHRLLASRLGDDVLRFLHERAVRASEAGEPQLASVLGWFLGEVILDDEALLRRWVREADEQGAAGEGDDEGHSLISAFRRVEPAVFQAIVEGFRAAGPAAARALLRLVVNYVYTAGMADEQAEALLPVMRDVDALCELTHLPGAHQAAVSALEGLLSIPGAGGFSAEVALRADERISGAIRSVDPRWQTPRELTLLLQELGAQYFVGSEWDTGVRAAAARVIENPALFELLLRWIDGLEALGTPVRSEGQYVYVRNALLEVAAAASERMPEAFFNLARTLPLLRRRLVRSALHANSYPARQAAFVLLSFAGTIDTGVVDAIRVGLRDNVLVQQTVLQTLDRYRTIDQDALAALTAGLQDPSATFAFATLRLLAAAAQNPRVDDAARHAIVQAVARVLETPEAARDVFLGSAVPESSDSDGWTIRYAGELGHACYEVLSRLCGLSSQPAIPA